MLRPLYKALLRSADAYDADPALRLLLAAARQPVSALQDQPAATAGIAVAGDALRRMLGGARLYAAHRALRAASFREELRCELRYAVGSSHAGAEGHLADSAFALLRWLDGGRDFGARVLLEPEQRAEGEGTQPRASLSLLHPAGLEYRPVRAGDVLVSHPLMRRDVVLLLDERSGLVLNDPTNERYAVPEVAAALGDRVVHRGGPVDRHVLTVLHPHPGVIGAVPTACEGLFQGGDLSDAAALCRSGEARPADFLLFRGRAEWATAAELEAELRHGEWAHGAPASAAASRAWPPVGTVEAEVEAGAEADPDGAASEAAGAATAAEVDEVWTLATQRVLRRTGRAVLQHVEAEGEARRLRARLGAWASAARALGLAEPWLRLPLRLEPPVAAQLARMQEHAASGGVGSWRRTDHGESCLQ